MLAFVAGDQLPMHMAVALSYEVDAAANLLRRSLLLVREFRIASLDADPLFACLAIGMEKLTKLTLGLAAIEEHVHLLNEQSVVGGFEFGDPILHRADFGFGLSGLFFQRLDRRENRFFGSFCGQSKLKCY